METDFRDLLVTTTGVAALIGTRLYPGTYAQATDSPAARYQKVTGTPGVHMQGSDGLWADLMQLDVRALTAASAIAVRAAIVAALHGYRGSNGLTDFRLIALQSDRGIQFDSTGAEAFYTASLDFAVSWRAA